MYFVFDTTHIRYNNLNPILQITSLSFHGGIGIDTYYINTYAILWPVLILFENLTNLFENY